MSVTPGQPCLVEGLGKETAAGSTQGSIGIAGLRHVSWPYAGSLDATTALKYDTASGKPYVDPQGTPLLIAANTSSGRTVNGDPGGAGVSMLAGSLANIPVSLTNTNPRPIAVHLAFEFDYRMRTTVQLTTAGINERNMTPTWSWTVGATPAAPGLGAFPNSHVLSAALDAGGFGGWSEMGGHGHVSGSLVNLNPGQTINMAASVGYSSTGGVAGAYDFGILYSMAVYLFGYDISAGS